jgi:hypothetical protein
VVDVVGGAGIFVVVDDDDVVVDYVVEIDDVDVEFDDVDVDVHSVDIDMYVEYSDDMDYHVVHDNFDADDEFVSVHQQEGHVPHWNVEMDVNCYSYHDH